MSKSGYIAPLIEFGERREQREREMVRPRWLHPTNADRLIAAAGQAGVK